MSQMEKKQRQINLALQLPKEIKEESANGHDEKHDPKVESNFHGSHSVINIF